MFCLENLEILDTWYIEDLNSIPSQFILQPISSILINFNNKVKLHWNN